MIPVCYNKKQSTVFNDSVSPSSKKPKLLMDALLNQKIPIELIKSDRIELKDYYRVHSKSFVDDILSGKEPNGFENTIKEVNDTLRYTTGSMWKACQVALDKKIAMSPTSGFHHASYSESLGFCTFNGLMVSAMKLVDMGLTVGIVDCDAHYGNGTDQIIKKLNMAEKVKHFTIGSIYSPVISDVDQTPEEAKHRNFHMSIPCMETIKHIPDMIKSWNCDILIYQAGADPHVNDPFGGILTTEQLYVRDQIVLGSAKKLSIPIAWNLAGGYQKNIDDVLEIHLNTFKAALELY